MQFTLLGLALIALAWAVQFLHSWNKGKSLSIPFVALYGAGVIALIFDSFTAGQFSAVGWLNLVTLLLVVLILLKNHR